MSLNEKKQLAVVLIIFVLGTFIGYGYGIGEIDTMQSKIEQQRLEYIKLFEEYYDLQQRSVLMSSKNITLDESNDTKYLIRNAIFENQTLTNRAFFITNIFENCTLFHTTVSPMIKYNTLVFGSRFVNCTVYGYFDISTNYIENCKQAIQIDP